MALFGFPFFCAGVGLLLVSFGVIPVANGGLTPWVARPLIFFMGLVFTAVGGVLAFGRSWTTFNAGDRTVVVQHGLLVPMHTATHPIGEYSAVMLDFQRGDSDTADQFPVVLRARAGRDLKLFSPTEYAIARQRAAAVATLFNLEIEDRTTDHAVRIAPGQAELPFQHRARMEHQREESVARPSVMTSEVSEQQGALRIVIPKRRTQAVLYLFYAVPVIVPLVVFQPFLQFFGQTRTPDPIAWIILGVLAIAFGVLPVVSGMRAFLKSRLGRTIVNVSSAGITIEERSIVRTQRIASLAATDIMDIDFSTTDSMLLSTTRTAEDIARRRPAMAAQPVGPATERLLLAISKLTRGGGVTIKTRHGLTTFGEGLSDDEIRYLHSSVRRRLISGHWTQD